MFNYFSELEALQYLDMDNRSLQHWSEDRNLFVIFRRRAANFLRNLNPRRILRRSR